MNSFPNPLNSRLSVSSSPNVNGLNFVLFGYLEKGVSSCTRIDPQAKGLGEYLASRRVDVPVALVPNLSGASSVMEVMR